jgi:hypothetical protein
MEVSFGANQTAAADVSPATDNATPTTPPTPTPTPLPELPPQLPAVRENPIAMDWIPDFKDIIVPHINIVQNIGGLTDTFESGQLVYNQATILFTPPKVVNGAVTRAGSPPVSITVLGFRKPRFIEKVVGGIKGMLVETENAVRAAGGTLDYQEWNLKKSAGMKLFGPMADAFVAIQRPEDCADDETVFGYEIDGLKYTLGIWSFKFSTYTAACKSVFFPARQFGCLKVVRDKVTQKPISGGYPTWSYAVSTKEKSFPNGNASWVPVIVPNKKSSPAFLEFAREVLQG